MSDQDVLDILRQYKKKQIDLLQIQQFFNLNIDKANIPLQTFGGCTPLIYAVIYKLKDLILLLFEPKFNCNLYLSDASNSNVLHNYFANWKSSENSFEVLRLLLSKMNHDDLKKLLN